MITEYLRHLINDWGQSFLIQQAAIAREDVVRNGVPDVDGLPDDVQRAGRILVDMRAESKEFQDAIVEPY